MTRKALLIAALSVVMASHMTACSSSGSKDDSSVAESNDETFAEEGEGDFADTASTDTATTDTTASTDAPAGAPEDSGADLSLEGGDQSVAATDAPPADGATDVPADVATDTPPATDVAATDKPADDLSLDDPGALPADTGGATPTENITDNPAQPSDAGVFNSTEKPADPVADVASTEPVPDTSIPETTAPEREPKAPRVSRAASGGAVSFAALMKVKEGPFTAPGGATMNRVYIARPKDTAKSIATKVYNDPKRSKDLVKWNPVLKRGARAGDKVYYSSAANPSDSRMMNFYEEAGVAPQSYTTKDGDNLRTVAKNLLGFKDAWKEVWETNQSVESKGKVPAGLNLSYWPETGTAAPVQTMAQTGMPPADSGLPTSLPDAAPQVPSQPTQAANVPQQPVANQQDPFANPPPTTGTTTAQNQPMDNGQGADPLAPPPPNDAMGQQAGTAPTPASVPPTAAGTTTTDPLAPPVAQVAPPAKPKKAAVAKVEAPAEEGGMDPDTTMALGVGGVLILAAAILFVVIRKNRAKRMDLGQTQV